jgi:hypothetical protein
VNKTVNPVVAVLVVRASVSLTLTIT